MQQAAETSILFHKFLFLQPINGDLPRNCSVPSVLGHAAPACNHLTECGAAALLESWADLTPVAPCHSQPSCSVSIFTLQAKGSNTVISSLYIDAHLLICLLLLNRYCSA